MQVNTLQKFDGHRHCGRKDINISANKVIGIVCARDCMCPLNFTIIIFSKVYGVWHALTYGISDLNNVPG